MKRCIIGEFTSPCDNIQPKKTLGNKITMSVKMLFPNTKASPEVGARRPTSMDIVVLFPAPLCPATPICGRK